MGCPQGFVMVSVRPLPVHTRMDFPMYVVRVVPVRIPMQVPILIFCLKMGFGSKASYGKKCYMFNNVPGLESEN